MTAHIALHELRFMILSPFAWLAAGLLQLLLGWLFLSAIERYAALQATQNINGGLTSFLIVHFLAPASVIFMVATPLLCMHLIAGDKQANRYHLLLSLPLTAAQLVMGKFIGATVFQYLSIALTALTIAVLTFSIDLDIAHLLIAATGLLLFISTVTALTLFYSAVSGKAILAGFASFFTLALLWLAAATSANGVLQSISPSAHLHSFMQGLIDSRDILYFVTATGIFLALAMWRYDAQRTGRVAA